MLPKTLAASLLAVTTLAACAIDATPDDAESADELSPEQLAELAKPVPADVQAAHDRETAARLGARGDRTQAYLDAHVIPALDRALRATSNIDFATLRAELFAAAQAGDSEAVKARLDRFHADHDEQIEAALAYMGTTAPELAAQVRAATEAGEVPDAVAAAPHTRARCQPGVQLSPAPPFLASGIFTTGTNSTSQTLSATPSGALVSQAEVIWAEGAGYAWLRADHLPQPPIGNGSTLVTAAMNFTWMSTEELLWIFAYSAGGVGVTIEMRGGGPQGPLLGSCRTILLTGSINLGHFGLNTPKPVVATCRVPHGPTPYISTRVLVDTFGVHTAAWGGFSQSSAAAQVSSITHSTCVD